jgi:hypothetical protein
MSDPRLIVRVCPDQLQEKNLAVDLGRLASMHSKLIIAATLPTSTGPQQFTKV